MVVLHLLLSVKVQHAHWDQLHSYNFESFAVLHHYLQEAYKFKVKVQCIISTQKANRAAQFAFLSRAMPKVETPQSRSNDFL